MSTVTGRYFIDANASDVEDAGDAGVSGATVHLYRGSVLVASTTTDASGNYRFDGIDQGYHYVKFDKSPLAEQFVRTGVGRNEAIDNDVWKTDADGAGISGSFYVGATSGVSNVDAGVLPAANPTAPSAPSAPSASSNSGSDGSGSIAGRYFFDVNKSDKEDSGDAGVANTTVKLLQGSKVVATTTTDANGNYSFADVADGGYTVEFSGVTGQNFARTGVGSSDLIDSDVWKTNADGSGTSSYILIQNGNAVSDVDAGLHGVPTVSAATQSPAPLAPASEGSLSGRFFYDSDASDAESAGDQGISGSIVRLMSNGKTVATTRTDSNGDYSFGGLSDGWYSAEFTLVSDAYKFARSNAGGDDSIDSDVWNTSGNKGVTASFEVRNGEAVTNVDAGIQADKVITYHLEANEEAENEQTDATGSVSGRMFEDKNGNGTNDNETGGPIVDVLLVNEDTGATMITKTNGSGWYNFDDVTPGTYVVRMSDVGEGTFTTEANVGSNTAVDSDAIGQWKGGTMFTAAFEVGANATVENIDFGYVVDAAPEPTEVVTKPVATQPTPTPSVTQSLTGLSNDLPDEMSVIFVGNSYQFYGERENWPAVQFQTLLETAGVDVTVRHVGVSSSTLRKMWDTTVAPDLIEKKDFDLLVLNGMTTVTSESGGASFAKYADLFTDLADANGTETMLLGPWAIDRWISLSGGDTFAPVAHEKYLASAIDNGVGYSPNGMAMTEAHRILSELYGNGDDGQTAEDMLTRDYVHATPLSGYLVANVLFESTFGQEAPSASEWRPDGVSLADAELMQDIAGYIADEYGVTPDVDFVA